MALKKKYEPSNSIIYSFKKTLPVMAGYIVLGIGFGILMSNSGYPWYYALLMSTIIYAGSMQYVQVDLMNAGANTITLILMTLVVNARHIFYGLSMLAKYKNVGKIKPYLIFSLTDETFSLVCSEEANSNEYYLLVSLFNQLYWIIGTLIGSLISSALPFNTTGIEFSMTALFFITMIEQWEKSDNHLPAITGIVVSVICLIIFKPSNFLIPSMLFITLCLIIEKKWIKEENAHE